MDTLHKGSQGAQVTQLQQLLTRRGHAAGEESRDKSQMPFACVPQPGDIVRRWSVRPAGWAGHVGRENLVREGTSLVAQGFSPVPSRMSRPLDDGHVP